MLLAWFLPGFLDAGYSWDDREALFENPAIRGFDLARILTEDYWEARGGAGVYRPVFSFALALDLRVWGDDPVALHRASLLLHGLAVLVLGMALDRLRPGLLWPAVVLLFFHPVAAEQAGWITGRSGSLMFGLGGLGLLAALHGRLVAAALCCFLAAHAREDGLLFVVVIALLVVERRRAWLPYGAVVVVAWLLARWLALGAVLPHAAARDLPDAGELALAPFASFGHAFAMLVLYEAPRVLGEARPATVFLAALPLFLGTTWMLLRRRSAAALGLVWSLLAFLPFARLVPFGEVVAGRFAYPLLPGLALAAGSLLPWRGGRIVLHVVPLLLVPLWFLQVRVLADPRRTFAQVLAAEPDNRRAALLLALAEENAGDETTALKRFRHLAMRHPDYAKAAVNAGRLQLVTGDLEAAERTLRDAVKRFPRSARAALTLGRVLYRRKRWADAAFAFEEALARNPREGQAARFLCRCFLELGESENARAALDRARRIDARHPALAELVLRLPR